MLNFFSVTLTSTCHHSVTFINQDLGTEQKHLSAMITVTKIITPVFQDGIFIWLCNCPFFSLLWFYYDASKLGPIFLPSIYLLSLPFFLSLPFMLSLQTSFWNYWAIWIWGLLSLLLNGNSLPSFLSFLLLALRLNIDMQSLSVMSFSLSFILPVCFSVYAYFSLAVS